MPPVGVKTLVVTVDRAARRGVWVRVHLALSEPRHEVRRAALKALFEHAQADALQAAVQALCDRSRPVRRYAADQLRQAGPRAYDVLLAALDDPDRRVWAAATLACTKGGRERLLGLPDAGCELLIAAAADDDLAISPFRVNVAKALCICPPAEASEALAALLRRSPMLDYAAGRALYARDDPRALEWVIGRIRSGSPSAALEFVNWLAKLRDPRALPALKGLTGFLGLLRVGSVVRNAAREAVAAIEAELGDVSDAALSRAARPLTQPSEAALSFWREDDEPEPA